MIRAALLALTPLLIAAAPASIDAEVAKAMAETGSKGFALATIENGKVGIVRTYGARNAKGDPLTPGTVMYVASITKVAFAYTVLQLVDEGKIGLDTPIERYLAKPLPDYTDAEELYADWSALKGDERWRKLTPRILLSHRSGFANFGFLEPDRKLRIHFEPGARYAYSGDGMILLQFVLEKGLGLDLGAEMQRRVFAPLGMSRTSMKWRPDFASNLADGWHADGKPEPHDERSYPRAAGSMDSTIADMAKLVAAFVNGTGLSAKSHAEMLRPQAPITTPSQFPTLGDELPPSDRIKGLSIGLGAKLFEGPQGKGFFAGGHNDSTGNMMVCIERSKRCVLFLGNDVRMEAAYPRLVHLILGETGLPWHWEYGDMKLLP